MSRTREEIERRAATWTYDNEHGLRLYYFAPLTRAPGPYREQRHVQAIVDVASDGTFAGVELIDNMPPVDAAELASLPAEPAPQPANTGWREPAATDFSEARKAAYPDESSRVDGVLPDAAYMAWRRLLTLMEMDGKAPGRAKMSEVLIIVAAVISLAVACAHD